MGKPESLNQVISKPSLVLTPHAKRHALRPRGLISTGVVSCLRARVRSTTTVWNEGGRPYSKDEAVLAYG